LLSVAPRWPHWQVIVHQEIDADCHRSARSPESIIDLLLEPS
jgi:hypothetical protein